MNDKARLISYSDYEKQRVALSKCSNMSGIRCPKCNAGELIFPDECLLLSNPPQRKVVCEHCGHVQNIYV